MEIDWKKKYNEALEKIKRYTIDKYGCTRLKPADIFPELSNDEERMKKAIIDALNSHNNSINLLSSRGYSMDDVISYLEKKEQQEVNCDFYNKELSDTVEDERIRNEILEYFLITRIKDFVANPERQKWISYIERRKESGIRWYKSDNRDNPKKPYIDKTGMFYTTDGRMCYASEIENQKERTEELPTRLNGLMQEYVKSGKDEKEQEHRLKCYHLFWDALGDSEFFKQKEQKLEENSVYPHSLDEAIQLYYYTYGNGKGGFDYLSLPKFQDIVEDFVKNYGQKPAEWSKEDKTMLNNLIRSVHMKSISPLDEMDDRSKYEKYEKFLASLPERFGLQPQQEWSDEDERMYNSALWHIKNSSGNGGKTSGEYEVYHWVKSLKERLKSLRPQPKQECNKYTWSDIDKGILKDAITAADLFGNDENYKKEHPNLAKAFRIAKDWLKSLPERFDFQTKQKWNEEDEYRFKLLMAMCEDSQNKSLTISTTYREMQETKDWLENRFKFLCLRPKQEWDEEDKEILKSFKFICKKLIENPSGEKFSVHCTYAEKMLKFLESLSPDSKQEPTCSWKPSKEQMGFLNGLLTTYMTVGQKQQLKSLIGDLKKL